MMNDIRATIANKPIEETYYTLFVGSLAEQTTQEGVHRYFSKFGHILASNLISDWTTGSSKRCAIIFCAHHDTYRRILKSSKHILDGKKIRVAVADQEKKGTKKISTTSLFVGNIFNACSENQLAHLFNRFGHILSIRFFRNVSTKPNTKNAIVEFGDSESVERAFKEKASLVIEGVPLKVSPLKQKRGTNSETCCLAEINERVDDYTEALAYCDQFGHSEWECFTKADVNLVCAVETLEYEEPERYMLDYPNLDPENLDFDAQAAWSIESPSTKTSARRSKGSKLPVDLDTETPGLSSGTMSEDDLQETCSEGAGEQSFQCCVTLVDIFGEDEIATAFYGRSPLRSPKRQSTLQKQATGILSRFSGA